MLASTHLMSISKVEFCKMCGSQEILIFRGILAALLISVFFVVIRSILYQSHYFTIFNWFLEKTSFHTNYTRTSSTIFLIKITKNYFFPISMRTLFFSGRWRISSRRLNHHPPFVIPSKTCQALMLSFRKLL